MRVVKPHFLSQLTATKRQVTVIVLLLLTVILSGHVVAQDITPTPTEEPPPQVLKIWWPDMLAAPENEAIQTLLARQTETFASTRENVLVESRLKRVGTSGGILSTLRTGIIVAPDAMPSVTLIRRQDLVLAELAGLLQSMEGLVPSAVQGDLKTALQLGQVNGELYGLPYMLDLQHVVYRADADLNYDSWSYHALLEREQDFVFPAGRVGGLSDVVFLQYLAAGGNINADGQLALNEDALRTTLDFYEQASDMGIIDGFTLNFVTENDYLTAFINEEYAAGVFSSSQYLRLVQADDRLQIAPIPTPTGQPTGVLNGWMWVLIADAPEQQRLALDYIMWMVDPARQADVAQTIHMLPSRRSALAAGLGDVNDEAYITLLDNAILPITESEGGALARTMQDALSSVLTLERTAGAAVTDVLEQQAE